MSATLITKLTSIEPSVCRSRPGFLNCRNTINLQDSSIPLCVIRVWLLIVEEPPM